jgi:DNA-directed RNA polymerase subunit RPC12/RpoP
MNNREFFQCQRCGKIFSEVHKIGSTFGGLLDITRHAEEKICPFCGGRVIWVDQFGVPISPYKRAEWEREWHSKMALFWAIIAIVFLLLGLGLLKLLGWLMK